MFYCRLLWSIKIAICYQCNNIEPDLNTDPLFVDSNISKIAIRFSIKLAKNQKFFRFQCRWLDHEFTGLHSLLVNKDCTYL